MKTLAIIGGGAAGLAAAVAAAERLRSRGDETAVVVYEADERVGRSILATGNGRCNFSNAQIDAAVYRNAPFVRDALFALKAGDEERVCTMCSPRAIDPTLNPVHEFFADHGLEWREEAEGRMYPLPNKASAVLDVLRFAAARCEVREECGCRVVRVEAPRTEGGRFTLVTDEGVFLRADAVIVACGGRPAGGLLPEEVPFEQPVPVLGPLRTRAGSKDQAKELKILDNVRVRCRVDLMRAVADFGADVDAGVSANAGARAGVGASTDVPVDARAGARADDIALSRVASEDGELLFRSYGVSGIAVFNLSRFARPGDKIVVDMLPHVAAGHESSYAFKRYDRMVSHVGLPLSYEDFLRGLVLPQISNALLKRLGLNEEDACKRDAAFRLVRELKAFAFEVEGVGDVRQCQAHRGGFSVAAVDEKTMQVRTVPGLYLAGEALDVDAPCGGYNLHWAWASGLLAGRSAAMTILGEGQRFVAPVSQCAVLRAGEKSC